MIKFNSKLSIEKSENAGRIFLGSYVQCDYKQDGGPRHRKALALVLVLNVSPYLCNMTSELQSSPV